MDVISKEFFDLYSDFIGEDGKFIILDSLPEETKKAFKFFNDNNINIYELNSGTKKIEDDYDKNSNNNVIIQDEDDEFAFDDTDSNAYVSNTVDFSVNKDINLDDLNDIF